MGIALATYLGDNAGYPFSVYVPSSNQKNATFWFDSISPCLNTAWGNGVFPCPVYKGNFYPGSGEGNMAVGTALGAYAYNGQGATADGGWISGYVPGGLGSVHVKTSSWIAVRESDVKYPSDMYALGDALVRERWPSGQKGVKPNMVTLARGITWRGPIRPVVPLSRLNRTTTIICSLSMGTFSKGVAASSLTSQVRFASVAGISIIAR